MASVASVLADIFDSKNAREHGCHLFLGGIPIAGDALLHAFGVYSTTLMSFCKAAVIRYALRTTQLQHALYVLAEELRFNGEFVGQMPFNDLRRVSEDGAQLQRMVIASRESDGSGFQQAKGRTFYGKHSEAHDGGARIDTEDDAFHHRPTFGRTPVYGMIIAHGPLGTLSVPLGDLPPCVRIPVRQAFLEVPKVSSRWRTNS